MEDILKFSSYEEEIEHESLVLASRFLSVAGPIMKDMGIKKKDLAERINMKGPHITKVFNGDKLPSMEFLAKIQKALGIRFEITVSGWTSPVKESVSSDVKIISVDTVRSLEITKTSSWTDKKEYCRIHNISMVELDKKLKG